MTISPQQPGLRSFIVYDRVPAGLAAFPITDDRNAPHLRVGDFVVVDPADNEPCDGELFVTEWRSSPGQQRVNETFTAPGLNVWAVGPVAQPAWVKEAVADGAPPATRWCDFGYSAETLRKCLKGRVIGLLQSTYAEPTEVLQ